jgi:VWFA-related protein
VEVLIVFDLVNLPFNEVSYSRQQVANFLRQNGGHLAQPVAIYWLTDTGVKAQQAPVLDGDALAQAIESQAGEIRSLNRSAGANGAIERFEISLKMLTEIAESIKNTPGRKLVIWAGPGWPLLDNPNLNFTAKVQQNLFAQIVQLSTLLREARIELSSISQGMSVQGAFLYQSFLKGVKKPQQANLPNLGLKVLAVQSGGLVLPPTNDLAAALTTCVQDASAYYTLTFEAPPADGPNQYHELKLQVHKPGLTARTSTGYYDQP